MSDTTEDTAGSSALEAERRLKLFHLKRLRRASTVEVTIAGVIFYFFFGTYLLRGSGSDFARRAIEGLYEPGSLFSLLLLFAEMFTNVLTGRAIVVGIYASRSKRLAKIFDQRPSQTISRDPIQDQFDRAIQRSGDAMRAAQRRPNALLLVGTTVAMAGLLFFIFTLPDFGFFNSANGDVTPRRADIVERLLTLLPRLLMLIFIQVLAGFFMRQYRSSMEELRYYEAILRLRESQMLSFRILSANKQAGAMHDLAKSILINQDRDILRLHQGETTVILEAQKLEVNEFTGIHDKIFELLKSSTNKVSQKKSAE